MCIYINENQQVNEFVFISFKEKKKLENQKKKLKNDTRKDLKRKQDFKKYKKQLLYIQCIYIDNFIEVKRNKMNNY